MNEILTKISSYNLFNYLFSGIIFVVLCKFITPYDFIQSDPIIGLFLYYFIGLAISRVGSIIVEPTLKKIGFIKFVDYKDYLIVSKDDPKLEILSEANNMYRTLTSVFIILGFTKIYGVIEFEYNINGGIYILFTLLLIIFLFAHRKQSAYIVKIINSKK